MRGAPGGPGGSTWNAGTDYDLIVVGGGHAGVEAALVGSRLGLRTLLISMNLQTLGAMSCNPAIGGVGKGQLVREIDAMGGAMGRLADATCLQYRLLNRSKGPAVWSPRAQCDKLAYSRLAADMLWSAPSLDLRQGQVVAIHADKNRVAGIRLSTGKEFRAGAYILCAGTFLNGLIHVGENQQASGRAGEPAAVGLSQSLASLGVEIRRYKTGTPPRVDRDSVDFSRFEEQRGDDPPRTFRFYESPSRGKQLSCHVTYTTAETHEILRANLARSPLFSGTIEGVGPRYCPSVEDKVVRFADKERHQLFLEPETADGREMYVNGFSTSLPEDVQLDALRSVPGFERVRFTRAGYAIEYDCFPAHQIDSTLRLKRFDNVWLAGQINGTSGYEEAAAQGLLAAINAALHLDGRPAFVPGRDEAYLGVLVDDLVGKPLIEPYRMFTSRAEFRLLLRQDNADRRLMPHAQRLGLLEARRWERFVEREALREQLVAWLSTRRIPGELIRVAVAPGELPPSTEAGRTSVLAGSGSRVAVAPGELPPSTEAGRTSMLAGSGSRVAADWLRRPDVALAELLKCAPEAWMGQLDEDLVTGVEMDIKYAGYIERQQRAVESFRRNENVPIPAGLDYRGVGSLSIEARQRLEQVRPLTLGQASRVGGVDPTDIQALWVHLQRRTAPPSTAR